MQLLLDIIFIIFLIFGVFSLFFSLPGNLIILLSSLLYGLLTHFDSLSLWHYVCLTILLALGELAEYIAGVIGAKKHGASRAGVIGAIVGGIVGALIGATFLLGLGAIPGVFLGAFLGALIIELGRGRGFGAAFKAGWGAFYGRAFGIFIKFVIGLTMIFFIINAVYF